MIGSRILKSLTFLWYLLNWTNSYKKSPTLEYLIKTWLETNKLPYQKLDLTLENQAYQEFITFKKIKNNKKAYLKKYKTELN